MNIVLTGMMGSGKTTVGKKLAQKLGMDYIDTDEMIEKDVGKSINEIFEKKGESEFRRVEKKAVKMVAMLNNYVISTGGGVVKDMENMEELERNGLVVCLWVSPDEIYNRTKKQTHRPLLNVKNPVEAINKIVKERKKLYNRCDFMIETTNKKVKDIVNEIIEFIEKNKESSDAD